ncbi:uncharacterized protein EV420DRAFT_595840 [Desarmillaria tabescens]|uniref:Uncharacterized protein n=1 Tax=Armillaria tabescens TaxID=1929756 RepID=A0AA39N2R5_ARMTA|nr:uncharacterized protein EV420DRAFT_595840 [Desarmillaria tabescens]KAK0455343.1 hypothetical protein EV420DRAFT_595840 [Desarmillaria tabescens]
MSSHGDVDLLVADIQDANVESGCTFRSIMSRVTSYSPAIVILENVCSGCKRSFHGHSTTFSRVDIKQCYIPHMRTRIHLIAVNKKNSAIPDEWKDCVTIKLGRPSGSSTLDAFLLASDHSRIHHARQKLMQEGHNALHRRTGRTNWSLSIDK